MFTTIMSSDQARSNWREVLETAVAGHSIVIERYGKPVAAIIPYDQFADEDSEKQFLRETSTVYQTADWDTMKAELVAAIKAELKAEAMPAISWEEGWRQLRKQVSKSGGIMVGLTKDEIVSRLRQTRQEIFEAEYAHLYR
ncbi:MAG: type II toxin-antitoxin system Phd/YefM family antitoxin [Anaerolineales bacterium]|nr:type II toxin-antitoxin system Phd/YefM family antitoxin [Anaerolineales bacterium]MCA9928078.1 type II toxin-antitoxin system Phd/YefM family antitoxin [Anaerolineales bacterium]